MPSAAKTASMDAVNFVSRSRMRNLTTFAWSRSYIERLRAKPLHQGRSCVPAWQVPTLLPPISHLLVRGNQIWEAPGRVCWGHASPGGGPDQPQAHLVGSAVTPGHKARRLGS
jgi:hypothetical protein